LGNFGGFSAGKEFTRHFSAGLPGQIAFFAAEKQENRGLNKTARGSFLSV